MTEFGSRNSEGILAKPQADYHAFLHPSSCILHHFLPIPKSPNPSDHGAPSWNPNLKDTARGLHCWQRQLDRGLRRTLGQLRRSRRRLLRRRRHPLALPGRPTEPRRRPPAWSSTRPQLAEIRDQCRALAVSNEFAINGHENRISYIVGSGHSYRVLAKPGRPAGDAAAGRSAGRARRVRPRQQVAQAAAGDRPPQGPRRRVLSAAVSRRRRHDPAAVRRARPGGHAAGAQRRPLGRPGHPDRPRRRGDRARLLDRRPVGRRRPKSSIARPTSTPTCGAGCRCSSPCARTSAAPKSCCAT